MPAPTPTILTGLNAVVSVGFNSKLYDCVMGAWRARAQKQFFQATTFCSGGWVSETPGFKQVVGSAVGFLSRGDATSDPLLDFGGDAVPGTLQADTGSTLTGSFHLEKNFGIIAGGASEYGIDFRSKGSVASSWNVTTP